MRLNCPRCGTAVDEEYYGPCTACRDELRTTMGSDARTVVDDEYEPKMNVMPNAVAVKE